MATERLSGTRAGEVMPRSVEVLDPLPRLRIVMPDTTEGTTIIETEGVTETIAFEIPWGPIIDFIVSKVKTGGGGGGGGGGGKGCTTISITAADGSTTTIKQCPPPA
jgi:hypothetical protein